MMDDQIMLPSPGFSIPSIGTPLHHPEEDQQILNIPGSTPRNWDQQMPLSHQIGFGMHQGMSTNVEMPLLMNSAKSIHTYAPSFNTTPHSMIQPQQPQTPVDINKSFKTFFFLISKKFFI